MGPLPETADRFAPGDILAGRYQLGRLLGHGGMGRVWAADDLRLRQPVALKLLAPALAADPVRRRRFLDEVRFAREVSHVNVCRVYDVGEAKGHLFLSMERIDGEDLGRLLASDGPLPPERATAVAVEICRGLAAIHARGLLHRDLKPANVMVDAEGRARLTDFGLAAPAAAVAAEPVTAGTLDFMAPELLAGKPATMRSDLYALGLVIHEVFTGRRLFPKHALTELTRRHREAVSLPPVEIDVEAGLDPDVARLVRWCLATDPRERPASAEAVEAAFLPDAGQQPGRFLKTLVASDDRAGPAPRALLAEHGGREVASTAGPLWLFERPWGAVGFALAWRSRLPAGAAAARIAIHVGDVELRRPDAGPLRAGGEAVDLARRLAAMARPGQTLLTPHAFDLARHQSVSEVAAADAVRWLSHGRYLLAGSEEATEIFEVGLAGSAPLTAPDSSELARPLPEGALPGWRPAPGSPIPHRPGWTIERKLGEGGFGDIWLARDAATGEPRVFKFCYDLARLRALQREITIFRLLKEQLGERSDITRVLGWNFDDEPYCIESEYTLGGSLPEWAAAQGGLDRVPLAVRLEIVAQVATALAAAHSVGVLHKDVKPANVLISPRGGGAVIAQLCDFGIGAVVDRDRLAAAGFTVVGLTEAPETAGGSPVAGGGTPLYLAPELLEGKPPTTQSDVYALGVVLYQMVVGDFARALAPGWWREVPDEILREDVEAAVEGSPGRRLGSALELAERLRSMGKRRAAREAEREASRRSERARRQRRLMSAALFVLAGVAAIVGILAWRIAREADRAEKEADAARQVADFLVEIFEGTDPFEVTAADSPGAAPSARAVLDRGARRLASELADQPEIRARLLNTVGRVYQRLALYDPAQDLFEQALALRRRTLGDRHPDVAESLHDLGWLLHLRGDEAGAEADLQQALAIRRTTLGPEHPYVASGLGDLAWVLQAKGDLDAAERVARQALAMKRRLMPDPDRSIAASLNHLAFLLSAKGDFAAAEPFAREALDMTRRLWGGEHPDVAESLNNLAGVLLAEGDPTAAEPLAREGLAMRRRLLGDDHPAAAQSLHDLALILLARRDAAAAEPLLEEALAIYLRRGGEADPGAAMCRRRLAALREAADDREPAPPARAAAAP